jgi:hypothetical protein
MSIEWAIVIASLSAAAIAGMFLRDAESARRSNERILDGARAAEREAQETLRVFIASARKGGAS